MTYDVFSGTLNPAQSVNRYNYDIVRLRVYYNVCIISWQVPPPVQ